MAMTKREPTPHKVLLPRARLLTRGKACSFVVQEGRPTSGAALIPGLNEEGLLPPGIHDCTLDEVGMVFGRFQKTEQRVKLYQLLRAFVRVAKATPKVLAVLVDGSFVTSKEMPGDIDVMLLVPAGHDWGAELKPFEYNLFSKKRVQKGYGFDLVAIASEGSDGYQRYLTFLQQVKGDSSRQKGILRVVL